MRNRLLIRVILSLTLAMTIVFCILVFLAFIIKADDVVEATGSVEADPGHIIRAASEGVIDKILVDDGSEVNQGDVIALQRNELQANQIEELKLKSRELQERISAITARIDFLKTDAHKSEIDALLITRKKEYLGLLGATTEKAAEGIEKDRMKSLLKDGLTSDKEYELALLRYRMMEVKEDQQKEMLTKIDQDIEVAKNRQTNELLQLSLELEQNKMEEKKARLQITHLEKQLALSFITSPQKGIIILGQEPEKLLGRQLRPGDKIADLIDVSSMIFRASVPETYIRKLKEGQSVKLEIKALPYQKFKVFKGIVRQIAKQASGNNAITTTTTTTANSNNDNSATNKSKDNDMMVIVDYDVKVQLIDNAVSIGDNGKQDVFYLKPGFSGVARIVISHDLNLINWLRIQIFGDTN